MPLQATAMLLLTLFFQSPNGPATTPNPDYPLHLQVLQTKANNSHYGTHGYGRGNLLGDTPRGVEFTYDCGTAFFNNTASDFYQARWKKQDAKLEILTQRIGSDHVDKCDLNVTLKPKTYTLR